MLTRTPATLRKSNPIHSLPSNVALAVAILTVAHRVMPCPYPSALHTYLSVFARACLGVMVQGSEHALATSQRRRRWRSTPCHVVPFFSPLIYPHVCLIWQQAAKVQTSGVRVKHLKEPPAALTPHRPPSPHRDSKSFKSSQTLTRHLAAKTRCLVPSCRPAAHPPLQVRKQSARQVGDSYR